MNTRDQIGTDLRFSFTDFPPETGAEEDVVFKFPSFYQRSHKYRNRETTFTLTSHMKRTQERFFLFIL